MWTAFDRQYTRALPFKTTNLQYAGPSTDTSGERCARKGQPGMNEPAQPHSTHTLGEEAQPKGGAGQCESAPANYNAGAERRGGEYRVE